jgi:hypothetical protein
VVSGHGGEVIDAHDGVGARILQAGTLPVAVLGLVQAQSPRVAGGDGSRGPVTNHGDAGRFTSGHHVNGQFGDRTEQITQIGGLHQQVQDQPGHRFVQAPDPNHGVDHGLALVLRCACGIAVRASASPAPGDRFMGSAGRGAVTECRIGCSPDAALVLCRAGIARITVISGREFMLEGSTSCDDKSLFSR